MCAIVLAALAGPRVINVIWWLLDSARWSSAFGGGFILPVLGIIALPWTTLAFVVVAPQGLSSISGFGFVVVLIGFLADLGTYGGSAYKREDLGFKYGD
jgi:hypothetical protein